MRYLLTTIVLSLGLAGCSPQGPYGLQWGGAGTEDAESAMLLPNAFHGQALQILKNRCATCHQVSSGPGGVFGLNSVKHMVVAGLVVPGQPEASKIYREIETQSMPPKNPLSASEQAVIYHWIAGGANGPVPAAPPPPPPPPIPDGSVLDFATVQKYVLVPSCVRCHSGAGKNRGHVNLETFTNVIAHLKDIRADILDGSMPKKGSLTTAQRDLILDWLADGASEHSLKPIPMNHQNPPIMPTNDVPARPVEPELQRGWAVFNESGCNHCHTSDPVQPLAGGLALKSTFGTFYVPNISPDAETGIGRWTGADFKRALRKGISPKGEFYYPAFPYTNYSLLSDQDIAALYTYLRAQRPVARKNTPHELPWAFRLRVEMGAWRALFFKNWKIPNEEMDYRFAEGPFVELPSRSAEWNRGAYLIDGPLHCTQCHTPRDRLGGLRGDHWMAGAQTVGDVAPNLTPDRATGLGLWKRDHWRHFLKTGEKPDGEKVTGDMRKMILAGTSLLSDEDLEAVIVYLEDLTRSKIIFPRGRPPVRRR